MSPHASNRRSCSTHLHLALVTTFLALLAAAPAAGAVIAYGETAAGDLAVAGEADEFTFTGAAGDAVLIRLAEGVTILEPQITLQRPGGAVLQTVWDYSLAEVVQASLPVSGTYTIRVSDNGNEDTGSYSLHVQNLKNPVGAVAIAYGQVQGDALTARAQTRSHRLTAAAGDVIIARLAETGTDFYPSLRIYDATGALVTSAVGGSVVEIAGVTLPAAGQYTLMVLDYNGNAFGPYNLHVQRLNGPAGPTALPIGATLDGALVLAAESDAYSVTATAGDILLLRLVEAVAPLEPQLRIYSPAGVLLHGTWDYSLAEITTGALPVTGTYTVLVTTYPGLDAGAYSLHAQNLKNPVGAVAIAYGQVQGDALTARAQTRSPRLTAEAGDVIIARLAETGTDFYPSLRIYDATGALVTSAVGGSVVEIAGVTLPAAGQYTLMVLDYNGNAFGPYNLHVQRLNGPAGAQDIAFGVVTPGTVTLAPETRAFVFTGAAGDSVHVVMTEVTATLEPRVRLYAPDGSLLAGAWDYSAATLSFTPLPQAGSFLILACDYPGEDVGDFTLVVNRTGGAVPVPEAEITAFALHPAYPNPFNPRTTLAYDLPAPSHVRLVVLDLTGRTVAVLLDDERPAGRHTVAWDGRNSRGQRVAAGVYLGHIEAGGETATTRLVAVK